MPTKVEKSILVTGCNGGIGRALCQEFKSAGYIVIGTDIQEAAEIESDYYVACDLGKLTSDSNVQNNLLHSISNFLHKQNVRIYGLVNNAAHQLVKPLDKLTISEFIDSQKINFIAPFVLAKIFSDSLREVKGTIVNIGSIHSRLTKPGFCAYSTSKAGLSGLSRALALEFSGDVTVNAIMPAATRTDMLLAGFNGCPEKYHELESYHPVGRIAEPVEIAKLALYLCSEDARFINGAEIQIDGGISSRLHDPI